MQGRTSVADIESILISGVPEAGELEGEEQPALVRAAASDWRSAFEHIIIAERDAYNLLRGNDIKKTRSGYDLQPVRIRRFLGEASEPARLAQRMFRNRGSCTPIGWI